MKASALKRRNLGIRKLSLLTGDVQNRGRTLIGMQNDEGDHNGPLRR